MTAISDISAAELFLSPLEQQQETVDFLYFIEKADSPAPSLHANNYFSPLRTLFLSQHKNPLAIATLYSPLICRDGLLELCHFFYSYPEPSNGNIYLLIQAEFANFVPAKWRSQVGFYEYRSLKKETSQIDNIYILLTLADKTHCSLSFQEKQTNQLKEKLGNQWSQARFHIVPVSPRTTIDKPELSGEVMAHYSQSVHALSQICGSNIKALAWNEVTKASLSNAVVIDMNEHSLFYGDSFLTQHFLKEGGQVLNRGNLLPTNSTTLKMSFHHELRMNTTSTNFSAPIAQKIEAQLTRVLRSKTYLNEASAFDQQMATRKDSLLKDYCPSFKSIIHQTAAEYL